MDRGDEISEAETVLQTQPPAPAFGHVSDLAVPLPLPPRAFALPVSSSSFPAAEAEPIADMPIDSPPADEAQLSVDDVFSQIRSEASMRSATAFIEGLNHPEPSREMAPVTAASNELSIGHPAPPEPPVLQTPALDIGRLEADVRWPPEPTSELKAPAVRPNRFHLVWRITKIAGLAAASWLALVLLLIAAYRFVNPPISALMLQKLIFGEQVAHEWVSIDNMSPNIVRAVLLSEDGRFCEHGGVDYEALQQAVEQAANGGSRGASTISMQVIKNLFLWPSKSYVRKAIEFPLTYVMEFMWPKRRIMEVYLNIAEWGPGVFGIQSAAQYHFNKTAWGLTVQEAARLAVALPNPIARDAGDPGYGTQRLAGAVQVRMRLAPRSQLACVLPKRPA